MKNIVILIGLLIFTTSCNKVFCWECTYENRAEPLIYCNTSAKDIQYMEEHTTDINANPVKVECKRTLKRN